MGFMSHRRRDVEVHPEQKWDFISLNDFKSKGCATGFAYFFLWVSLIISVAVYVVDSFTAIQLLIFDRWPSAIEPSHLIPFSVSKWIFTICIILSFINLGFEHIRARKIMKRGSVAESFLDSLAARLESIRVGRGKGYKRFLVFAELTKSKKGAEYVALFTYFSFQSWIRVIICSGPRQVVNALTLYSVYDTSLQINGTNFESSMSSFFEKIRAFAEKDYRLAVILSGMIFTLVIWIFAVLSLLLASVFFLFFLWHYIPRADGGLTGFCERKINKRLKQVVSIKINKAMAEEEKIRKKAEFKAAKSSGGDRPMTMQATLPNVGDDKLPAMPMLSRNDTTTTLPAYSARPGTSRNDTKTTLPGYTSRPTTPAGSFEMSALDQKRPLPSRTGTMATSNRSFHSGQPLQRMPSNGSSLNAGYTASPATYSTDTMPAFPAPVRSPMGAPNSYRGPGLPGGPGPNQPMGRANTGGPRPFDEWPNGRSSPGPIQPMGRANTGGPRPTFDDYSGQPTPGPIQPMGRANTGGPRPTFDEYSNGQPAYDEFSNGRSSPAPSTYSYRSGPLSPRGMGPDGYPVRSATNPVPPRGPQQRFAPQRNMTAPMPQHQATDSNGSLRSMPPPRQPFHQSTDSNGSMRSAGPRQQQPYHQSQGSNESEYMARLNPTTPNSQRVGGPRGGYGNNGLNQDVERGNGPRY
ncbi:hypothetical protein B0H63DRAFT_495078 [Podospora didyma]|uniref:Vacuolar membrane protein n=1 Tax=Podospora didyma TaxID=330526 RepID=A0AAE0NGY1_9PEZI|nr:hypothetical protein B0H63DRAFT_495078 [Podospora didyma]